MPAVHLFQIRHAASLELDPGFAVLDNLQNPRPDWYEYWPIRQFLARETLEEDAFYGFFSPKFAHKTNLSASAARDFILASGAADVVLLSPSIHNSAYYWSVFEHGEAEHPGLLRLSERLLERLGRPLDLDTFISDSRNTVYSNYLAAKPRFWRAWFTLAEQLFAIAERPEDPLGCELRAATRYRGGRETQMKVFILERLATLILVTDPSFTVCARDPFAARARFYKLPLALACDALKIAYTTQGRGQYKDVFLLARNLRKFLNLQIRVGGYVGLGRVAPTLRTLQAYSCQRRTPRN